MMNERVSYYLVDSLKDGPALDYAFGWALRFHRISTPAFCNGCFVTPGTWAIDRSAWRAYAARVKRLDSWDDDSWDEPDCFGLIQTKATDDGRFVSWIHGLSHEAEINHKDWPGYDSTKPPSYCFSVAEDESEAFSKCYLKFISGPFVGVTDGAAIDYAHLFCGDQWSDSDFDYCLSLFEPIDPLPVPMGFVSEFEKYEAAKYLVGGLAEKDSALCESLRMGKIQPDDETVGYIFHESLYQSAEFLLEKNVKISNELMATARSYMKEMFSRPRIMTAFDTEPLVFPVAPSKPRKDLSP